MCLGCARDDDELQPLRLGCGGNGLCSAFVPNPQNNIAFAREPRKSYDRVSYAKRVSLGNSAGLRVSLSLKGVSLNFKSVWQIGVKMILGHAMDKTAVNKLPK